jgi:uncharacterized protein YhfF
VSGFKPVKTDATDSFFRAFRQDAGVDADEYAVVAFGDSEAMADELLELVLLGNKRATAALARDYAGGGGEGREPLPAVGDHVVVVDGRGKPRSVWRTTDIDVKPLDAVDDMFAHDEGEGDRTRDGWLKAHRDDFTRQAGREGFEMRDDIETVFERFTIVWPRLFADGPKRLDF